jgi:membrane protein
MRFLRAIAQTFAVAFRRLGEERGFEAAASMSFYAVFAMFPLLLLLVAVSGGMLSTPDARERFLDAVLRFIPVSRDFVRQNVVAVVRSRGAVGGIGVVGLAWASSSAFGALVRNLNRAWPGAGRRNLLGERLISLAMVAALVALAVLFLVAKALLVLPGNWETAQRVSATLIDLVPSQALLWGFMLAVLTMLYRWLPRTLVLWREALAGAAVCSLALWGATALFTRFLASGLVSYNLVYGSLGTLIALLSWVYIACALLLCGAHVAAAIALNTRHAHILEEDAEEAEGVGESTLQGGSAEGETPARQGAP